MVDREAREGADGTRPAVADRWSGANVFFGNHAIGEPGSKNGSHGGSSALPPFWPQISTAPRVEVRTELVFTNVGKVFCVDVECVAIGRSHDISARSPCSVALVNGQEEVLLKAKNNAIGARRST